jgi:hypothetical protein
MKMKVAMVGTLQGHATPKVLKILTWNGSLTFSFVPLPMKLTPQTLKGLRYVLHKKPNL